MKPILIFLAFLLSQFQQVTANESFHKIPSTTSVTITNTGSPVNGITVAGGYGNGSEANQLNNPQGVFVDAQGNIYIADTYNDRIQKWAPDAMSGETVAGGNGKGAAANQLDQPSKVFVDLSGTVYISDQNNHRIQMWTKGAVAGVTVAGGKGRGAASNQLSMPYDIFVDKLGDLYISDMNNNRIQRWKPGADSGVTVAGGKGPGSSMYQLDHPKGIFVEDTHNDYRSIHIADANNDRIMYWPVGVDHGVIEAGGKGKGLQDDQLTNPEGLYLDQLRTVFIIDPSNNRVQKWNLTLKSGVTIAGGNGEGKTPDKLSSPACVFVDREGNIYVSDKNNNRIQKFGVPDNGPYLAIGSTVAGGNFNVSYNYDPHDLYSPRGLAVDKQGNVLVGDLGYNRIQQWAPGASSGTTIVGAGAPGAPPGNYSYIYPSSFFLDYEDNIYLPAYSQILRFSHGSFVSTVVAGGDRISCCRANDSSIGRAEEVYVNWRGTMFIFDGGYQRVVKWEPGARSGTTVAKASGQLNGRDVRFNAICGDATGNLYIAENNDAVKKYAPGDTVGVLVAGGNGMGNALNQLENITGIFVDKRGAVYVSDQSNLRIQKWLPGAKEGVTVAGGFKQDYYHLTNETNHLTSPQKIFVDAQQNLFVVDENRNRVLKFQPRQTMNCPKDVFLKTASCDSKIPVKWPEPDETFPSTLYIPLQLDPRGGMINLLGTFNGHGYYKSNRRYPWPLAVSIAGSLGGTSVSGHLATFSSAAENNFVFEKIKGGPDAPWIGLFNTGMPGMFHWVDNKPGTFTNWIAGEPNNAGGSIFNIQEPYVRMSNLDGKWNDQRDDNFQFVAEFEAPISYYKQISGPVNGSSQKAGVYTVCYEKNNIITKMKDTCCFNIFISCDQQPGIQKIKSIDVASEAASVFTALKISISPNPSSNHFKLQISSGDYKNPVGLKVTDLSGWLMESQILVTSNQTIEFGKKLKPGMYFVQVTQGANTAVQKIIKQ